jgi:hypothetical protein
VSTDLVRQKLESTLQSRSLGDILKEKQAERETFLLLDCSGSMDQVVNPQDRSSGRKIDALRTITTKLREELACPQVAFPIANADGGTIDYARLVDWLPEANGSTPLGPAIDYCRDKGARRIILVSDGAPDSEQHALEAARRFGGVIDVCYVGPPGTRGEAFLRELAAACGGQYQTMSLAQPKQIEQKLRGFLTAATQP